MNTREWRTDDKSAWGVGPWQNEPDKKQWIDEATGLPCLILRNHSGALCGYVGVSQDHPWFGKSYSDEVGAPSGFNERRVTDTTAVIPLLLHAARQQDDDKVRIDLALDVHGGITFADACHVATPEAWEAMKGRVAKARGEAAKYPYGDSAEWLARWLPLLDSFDAWRAEYEARTICHVTDGEGDRVWWFGFDCGHSGDLSPKYAGEYSSFRHGTYRDLAYVESEVAKLAAQLREVA